MCETVVLMVSIETTADDLILKCNTAVDMLADLLRLLTGFSFCCKDVYTV